MSVQPAADLPVVLQLRAEIVASGISFNELGRMAGIDGGRISRFVRGERTITLDAAARLCQALGLVLRPLKQTK